MSNLQIKNVPEEVHAELRHRAAARQTTARDYVLDLIVQDQAVPTMQDWLNAIRSDAPLQGVPEREAARLVREGRAERDGRVS
jgi:plasmid stability protein